jgi:hypothetical protein
MVPVFVKKIATVSPLSVSNSYFVPTPGRLSERRDIADIRGMILKYIMICNRCTDVTGAQEKNSKKRGIEGLVSFKVLRGREERGVQC